MQVCQQTLATGFTIIKCFQEVDILAARIGNVGQGVAVFCTGLVRGLDSNPDAMFIIDLIVSYTGEENVFANKFKCRDLIEVGDAVFQLESSKYIQVRVSCPFIIVQAGIAGPFASFDSHGSSSERCPK